MLILDSYSVHSVQWGCQARPVLTENRFASTLMSSFSSFLASFRPRTTDDLTHSSLLAPRLLFYTSTSSSSPQKQKHNKTVSFNTVYLSLPLNIYISTPSNLISIHTAAQNNYNHFQSSMRGWVGATSLFSKRFLRRHFLWPPQHNFSPC